MAEKYQWLIDSRAGYYPTGTDPDASDPIEGTIVEVRDDSPWEDEEHIRVVIDNGDRLVDIAKERVELQ